MAKSVHHLAIAALGVGLGVAGVAPAMAGTSGGADPANDVIALPTVTPVPTGLLGGLLGSGGLLDLGNLLGGSDGVLSSSNGLFGSQGGLLGGSSTVSDVVPLAAGGLSGVPVVDGTVPGLSSVAPAVDGVLAGEPTVGGEAVLQNPGGLGGGLLGSLLDLSSVTGLLGGRL
jgi:hypothetical protein